MDQRLSFVTLAVADLAASRRFYVDGLGWTPDLEVPGEVIMIRLGERLMLSLWNETEFEAEVGAIRRGPGVAPMTLAHNVRTEAEVDAVLATAVSAGASLSAPAARRAWGGYSGYFADPDGFRWEVAAGSGEVLDTLVP